MKILYLHQYFATRDGATGTRSYEFAQLLKEQGHDVEILTGDSQLGDLAKQQKKLIATYNIDGLTVHVIRNSYRNHFGKWRRIWAFLQFLVLACFFRMKGKQFDVIFATSTPLTIGIPALFLSWKNKLPFVFEVRDLWPEAPYQLGYLRSSLFYRLLCHFTKHIYYRAKHIIALSSGMKDGILKYGIPSEKVTVIPNSADLEFFKVAATGEFRKKYQLDGQFILAHVGSMGDINGLDYLIDVACVLKRAGRDDVTILLTGDGGKRAELAKLVEANQLENVIFTGKISKKKIPYLIAEIDATIMSVKPHPILEMASPNKFFDSLAAGKPTLVNTNGWMRELVETYQAGFFVKSSEPQDVLRVIDMIQQDDQDKFGINARKLAEEKFDRRKLALELEYVLQNSLDKDSNNSLANQSEMKM